MELKWKLHQCDFVFRGTTGTRVLMDVHRGTLVKHIAVRVGEIFNGISGITVGDGSDATKFGTITHGSLQLENLTGEYLCTDYDGGPNANGKLYTEDDTIIATITVSDTPTTGVATVYIIYAEIE